jgi:hexosaminidase
MSTFSLSLCCVLLYSPLMMTLTAAPSLTPIPFPALVEEQPGELFIDSSFAVTLTGYTDARLLSAVDRLVARIAEETALVFHGENRREDAPTLEVWCAGPSSAVPAPGADESYTLDITRTAARLQSPTSNGILRGLETFWQLLKTGPDGFTLPAVHIQDRPRYPWRGLLLDVCRHWMPMDAVKRTLDGMAAVKLNVLHWHLSENQGFRIESKRFPELHRQGSDGRYFTQDEVREIIAYAADRGIRVVPEFDMPGHTTSWFVGYPHLASAPGPYTIERAWGVFDPTMDPTREETYEFVDRFVEEMAGLFPDPYFHIGGDEVNGRQWNENSHIAAFKLRNGMKDNHDLQAYFNKRLQEILSKHGKKMIGWDEIFHPDLPNTVVIQSWRGQRSLAESARKGYQGILSFGYYLDHMLPASYHYSIDPLGGDAAALDSASRQRILGGEACMWSELVNDENVDSRIWPRVAAIAERLWSPPTVSDTTDLYRRLAVLNRRLDWVGLTHRTGWYRMLERLSGYNDAQSLETLSSILEPVKLYQRHGTRKYTSRTPLNRLVDATLPESWAAREFGLAIEALLEHPDSTGLAARIRDDLQTWRDACVRARPGVRQVFLLHEADTLMRNIHELTGVGLTALDLLEKAQSADQDLREDWQQTIDAALKPQAELLIKIAAPIQRLVDEVTH